MKEYKIILWAGTAALIIFSLYLLVVINQKTQTATVTNVISFSGQGKITAKPDVAVALLSIVTDATTSKDAQNQNSVKSQAVTKFLKDQGIAEKDIKTTSYNIYPQYSYPRSGKPEIYGYQVNESIEVRVRNLDRVSTILDGVVTAGVNQVNNLGLQIDNPEALKEQARSQAIADAKAKANALKNQLGVRLGKLVNYSEGEIPIPYPMYDRAAAMGIGGGETITPSIAPGENEITITVTLTYQIR